MPEALEDGRSSGLLATARGAGGHNIGRNIDPIFVTLLSFLAECRLLYGLALILSQQKGDIATVNSEKNPCHWLSAV